MVYRPNIDEQLCFVLMPFQELHLEYFEGIIKPAAKELGLTAIKADDIYGNAPIIQDIWQSIWTAKVIVADVTGKNPNVNYELGICHSLGVPTIIITRSISDVPFDYRHRRCIVYDTERFGWQDKLAKELTSTIEAVLKVEAQFEDLRWPYDTRELKTQRIVGSFVPAEEARETLSRAVTYAKESIERSFGIHGTSISVASPFGEAKSHRGGAAIAASFSSPSPLAQLGLDEVRAVTREVAAELGDGTKTAALLFCEMVVGGFSALTAGAVLRDLIRDMDLAVELVIKALGSCAVPVSPDVVMQIAITAAQGDENTGRLVHEAISKSGADGVVTIADAQASDTYLVLQKGMYFDRGFITDRFVTDNDRQVTVLDAPYVLLCAEKITSMHHLMPALEFVAREGGSLLIVAADVEGEALETLAINKEKKTLKCVAVRTPGSVARPELLEDLAVSTGAVIVRYASQLSNLRINQFGRADRVEVSKDSTSIIGPLGNLEQIALRAAAIRQQISVSAIDFERENLEVRLAKLVGATAVIRVGGVSSVDRDERRHRIVSALYSARAASHGAVLGGGAGLWKARSSILEGHSARGSEVVLIALGAPMRAQLKNSRVSADDAVETLTKHDVGQDLGFNAAKRAISNLREDGVLDALKIASRSLQIAFSHARQVLMTGAWDVSKATQTDNLPLG